MTVKFTNNASTTIGTGINASATSLTVASASSFPSLSGADDYCYLTLQGATNTTREVVKATALSGNTFTIVRAQDNTSAASWVAGDVVELRMTAALLTDVIDAATVEGVKTNYQYTPTAGQTVFSGADNASATMIINQAALVSVYMNGVRLVQGTDYSVSSANNTVTLGIGATTADIIDIEVYGNFVGQSGAAVGITGGSITGTAITATSLGATGTATLNTLVSNNATISGGSLDGVTIGGTTRGAISGNAISGTSFASTGDMTFGDNDKAIFGAGSDLQIYHDGGNSWVKDNGDGVLALASNGNGIGLYNADGTKPMLFGTVDAATNIYHNGNLRLATSSSGISVTGSVTADRAAVYSGVLSEQSQIRFGYSSDYHWSMGRENASTGDLFIESSTTGTDTTRLKIANNGDISFYEDTGTTPKFFWDASAESLGIGNSSPTDKLHLGTSSGGTQLKIQSGSGINNCILHTNGTTDSWRTGMNLSLTDGSYEFYDDVNNVSRMVIDSSGNLLAGKTATAFGTAGVEASASNGLWSTRSGLPALALNRLSTDGSIADFYKDGTTVGSIGTNAATMYVSAPQAGGMKYSYLTSTNAVMLPVTTTGAVADGFHDLGMSTARFKDLYLSGGVRNITDSGVATESIISAISGVTNGFQILANTSNQMTYDFNTGSGLKMRLTNDGNLLVGKTAASFATAGVAVFGSGEIDITNTNEAPLFLNRLGSDGVIQYFYKDGTAVGSIGNYGGLALDVGKGTTAVLRFRDSLNAIYPAAGIAGGTSDGVTSLGISSGRFKDLYLSGGVRGTSTIDITIPETSGGAINLEFGNNTNTTRRTVRAYKDTFEPAAADTGVISLGQAANKWKDLHLSGGVVFGDAGGSGTSSSNTLDSYEEGTSTISIVFSTTNATITQGNTFVGYYTKVGNVCTVVGYTNARNFQTTGAGNPLFSGLPFASKYGSYGVVHFTHNTFFTNSTAGYVETGTNYFYPIIDNGTNVAAIAGTGTRYLMFSVTYITT
jgi:hypothetical protein